MKNKFRKIILILFCLFIISNNGNTNEPFIFDVTEIEILENGGIINGYKGGTATSIDGSTFKAKNFFYNKSTNVLETTGNVIYFDKINNLTIKTNKAIYFKNDEKIFTFGNSIVFNENNTISASNLEYDKNLNIFNAKINAEIIDYEKEAVIKADEISYLKNEEKFFTKGKTNALIKKKYIFKSKNVSYFRNTQDLFSQNKSSVEDDNGNIYKLDNFSYNLNKELLKGKKVDVLAKVEKNKIDKYFFSGDSLILKTKAT